MGRVRPGSCAVARRDSKPGRAEIPGRTRRGHGPDWRAAGAPGRGRSTQAARRTCTGARGR